jgi:organic hydroperoxide reductase OsmC/OhrA
MSLMKEMQFPVSVRWRGGRLARADARNKESLELATPPEFRGGLAGYWSPEDLLVAAAASCFALTLAAVAERREAPLLDATISATGHMSRRDDGRFGFTVIEIDAVLETVAGGEEAVATAATAAEERCLITHALDVPVHVAVQVKTIAGLAGAAEVSR